MRALGELRAGAPDLPIRAHRDSARPRQRTGAVYATPPHGKSEWVDPGAVEGSECPETTKELRSSGFGGHFTWGFRGDLVIGDVRVSRT